MSEDIKSSHQDLKVKCDYPHCEEYGEYESEAATDDSGEEMMQVNFCLLHYNAFLNYNDEKCFLYWDKLTPKQKRQVTQIVYRWNNPSRNRHDDG
jgi:hypothetical protein